jgi:hypothetical protein
VPDPSRHALRKILWSDSDEGCTGYLFGLTLGFDPGTEMSWEQLFDAMYFYAYVSFVIGLVLYAVYEWQRSVRS